MSELRDDVDAIQEAWLRERPGTPVGSIGVITRIWRIARLLEDDRRRTMARLDMDPATRDLLATLRRSGAPYALPASELARRAAVTPGAVTQRVERAERHGLVRRRKNENDRRSIVVELTEKGHDLIEHTVDALLHHEETLLTALTPEQRDSLSDNLRILLADLSRRQRPSGRRGNGPIR